MFGRGNEAAPMASGMEVMLRSMCKALGLTPEFIQETAQALLAGVQEIRDNSRVARENSRIMLAKQDQIIAALAEMDREIINQRDTMQPKGQSSNGRRQIKHDG